ncbi:MAG: ATP-binding cassette domain-containing protein [Fusobacteriaceae bacterium]|jgi:ABC-type microcin C transport system duplicated ATPase subunit YejF|nr:ATP-binding cassette domain-containing protein [Fusobacteriaceae bacterium]
MGITEKTKGAQPDIVMDLKNLYVSIDRTELLKHIDMRIEKEEVVALVGESGSGKTLTSKFILGILPERSVVSYDKFYKTPKTGAVFQNSFTSLNPTVKIGSQLMRLYQSHYGETDNWKRKVVPLLEKAGIQNIDKFLKKYPHESSGGERQRVAIAGALISNPDLLIADEVTTALDLRTKLEVIKLFKNIRKELGITILFITHDLSSIKDFANRVYVMYKGEIVEENTCEELFRHQTHPYAKRIIGFANSLWTRDR